MFTKDNLSDGTQVRFLDIAPYEQPQMTAEEREQRTALMCRVRERCKDVVVPAVCDGQRVQLRMRRTTLDKINAIAKGEQ